MNPLEIAYSVCNSDNIIEADGMTNRERFHYICRIFDVDSISLANTFDYDLAVATEDPELIFAALQLALLQWQFVTQLHMGGHVSDETHEQALHYLYLTRSKLRWAFSFRRFGNEVPPYPFVN